MTEVNLSTEAAILESREPAGITKAQHRRLLTKLERARHDRDELRANMLVLVKAIRNDVHNDLYRRVGDLQTELHATKRKLEQALIRLGEKALAS
jgi:hypothetical protein